MKRKRQPCGHLEYQEEVRDGLCLDCAADRDEVVIYGEKLEDSL